MQMTMLLPSVRSNGLVASSAAAALAAAPLLSSLSRHRPFSLRPSSSSSNSNSNSNPFLPLPRHPFLPAFFYSRRFPHPALLNMRENPVLAYASSPAAPFPAPNEEAERAKLAQVSKRLESTSRYFKRLGSIGFWGQLVCTAVAAVILSFSAVITGKISSPVTFYATAAGIAAAFVSVFWSFGYIRLSERLRKTASEPAKAPPRAEVVKSLKNGIVVNLLGMGATVLGMQATVGLLVAKALTTSAVPYYQGISPGGSPVLALDVFLVQASANTILSHFLGLVSSLELLRSVTLPQSEGVPVPRVA